MFGEALVGNFDALLVLRHKAVRLGGRNLQQPPTVWSMSFLINLEADFVQMGPEFDLGLNDTLQQRTAGLRQLQSGSLIQFRQAGDWLFNNSLNTSASKICNQPLGSLA